MFYFLYSFKQITNLIKSTKIYCDVLMLDQITGEEKHQCPIRTVKHIDFFLVLLLNRLNGHEIFFCMCF